MLAVVEYGGFRKVSNALKAAMLDATVTLDPLQVADADALLIPGGLTSRTVMHKLTSSGLAEVVTTAASSGVPILGIDTGMHVLFDATIDRDELTPGLGILSGTVRLLEPGPDCRVPHIGPNTVVWRGEPALANDLSPDCRVYFQHVHVVHPDNPDIVIGSTEHGVEFVSAIQAGAICGVQFRPEVSGFPTCAVVLQNFAQMFDLA
jgi:imidazole glycerol phosphate synthase glutamine amidotransferase subunit